MERLLIGPINMVLVAKELLLNVMYRPVDIFARYVVDDLVLSLLAVLGHDQELNHFVSLLPDLHDLLLTQILAKVLSFLDFLTDLVLCYRQRVIVEAKTWPEHVGSDQAARTTYNMEARTTKVFVADLGKPAAAPHPRGDDREDEHVKHHFKGDLCVHVRTFG